MKKQTLFVVLISTLLGVGCASNKKKKEVEPVTPKLETPISVGAVLAKLEVVETAGTSKENQLKANVVEIIAYGANTEVISAGSVLTLTYNGASEELIKLTKLETGDIFEATITRNRVGPNTTSGMNSWRIVELKNQGENNE